MRLARNRRFAKKLWWKAGVKPFGELLYYRYLALREGEVPDPTSLFKVFTRHDQSKRLYEMRLVKLRDMVNIFDNLVRREHEREEAERRSREGG